MSVTIAMPRMSTDPELTAAQAKYPESLARAGADVRWVELSDPERAVQEALARAWARRGRVEADYFRPWLMRIVINECRTIGRKRRRVVLVDEVEQPAPAFEPPDDRLKQALSAVPEKLKVPLLLHYLEGFSVAEVAQILRIPQGTVKSRLHHARKRLRVEWEAMKE